MKNYTVQNTYRPNEVFYYQFDVNTQDNFNVANGGTAEIRSGKSVTLKPGTTLWFESDTKVAINGCNFSEYRLGKESTIVKANFYNPNSERVYEKYKTNNLIEKHHNFEPDILFSNFSAVVNSNSNLKIKSVILLDMTGKVVYRKNNISQSKYEIPFDDFSSGVYSIHSIFEDNSTYSKLISIKK